MKKLLRLASVFMIACLSCMDVSYVHATCSSTDVECYQVGGSQVYKLDSLGSETLSGSLTSAGIINSGAQVQTGTVTSAGKTIFTPTVLTGISTTTTITPTSTFMQLVSTGNIVVIGGSKDSTTAPFYTPIATATATNGQWLVLFSTGNSVVQVGTSSVNGTFGSASPLSTETPKVIQFIYSSALSAWQEIHN